MDFGNSFIYGNFIELGYFYQLPFGKFRR